MSAEKLEPWRKAFRDEIVAQFHNIPKDAVDLRLMCRFAESVAEEMGPRLRQWGIEESEMQAEQYAAHRASYLMGASHQIAAIASLRGVPGAPDQRAELAQLLNILREEPEFLECMGRKMAEVDDELGQKSLEIVKKELALSR